MYELSLLAFVEEKDVPAALTILTGVFDQKPWASIHHVYNYRGPGQPVGMANPHPTKYDDQPDVPALWKELDRALSRQSYSLQVRHEVAKEDFGKQEATDLNADPAKLRWVDFPEPPQMVNGLEKGAITQRKKLEIWGQKGLHSLVEGKGYTFVSDRIEEMHQFFRDDIEVSLYRTLLPVSKAQQNDETAASAPPSNPLPPWVSLTNISDYQDWQLQIKLHVLQDTRPDKVLAAQEQLSALAKELKVIFEFEVLDRHLLDTRVPLIVKDLPAPLPQVVKSGL